MKPAVFAYHRPTTVSEAVATLEEYAGEARILAGGQSLVPMLNMRLWKPAALIDINDVDELDTIEVTATGLRLGALVRYSAIERSAEVAAYAPLLSRIVTHIGDRQVRNRGTVGGALVHADPTGELALACLALDATVVAVGAAGVRRIPVRELYEGSYATVLRPTEMVIGVEIGEVPAYSAFAEICRKHNDFAVVSVAALGDRDEDGRWRGLRIAVGGVADTVIRATEAEGLLEGTRLADDDIAVAAATIHGVIDPPSDIRASAAYRTHLTPIQIRRVLAQLRDSTASQEVTAS